MSGLDKIIKEIQDEAASEAAEVVAKAKAKADEIIETAKANGEAKAAKIAAAAKQDVAGIENAQESAVALQRRQRTLEVKQNLLAETLDNALSALYELDDKEYFNLLVRLAAKTAQPGNGEMILNEKDMARKPIDFETSVASALPSASTLKLATVSRPIDGGFVLSYGGVEENCSFKAIFDANREDFYDLIRDTLFE